MSRACDGNGAIKSETMSDMFFRSIEITRLSRNTEIFSLPFPPKVRPPLPGRHIFAFPSSLPPCLLRLFRPPSPCFFRSQRTPCWSHAARPADVPVVLAVVRPMVPTGGGGPASYGLQFYNDLFIFMFQEVTFPLQWWDRLACPCTLFRRQNGPPRRRMYHIPGLICSFIPHMRSLEAFGVHPSELRACRNLSISA